MNSKRSLDETRAETIIPSSDYTDPPEFELRVAGHAGQLFQLSSGRLLKKTNKNEYDFYETSKREYPELRSFLPRYYGVQKDVNDDGETISIVLENLLSPFSYPSIIDIKLGTRHYEDSASPEKRAKMERKARETTSFETGLKICGMRVCQSHLTPQDPQFVQVYEREYGRHLTKDTLGSGFEAFFQVAAIITSSDDGLRQRMLQILNSIVSQVSAILSIVQKIPLRMYSGSMLIVYDHIGETDTVVRLVDFARSSFVPETDGPDAGLLFGLQNFLVHLSRIIQMVSS